jgi:hypothetical protein
MISKMFQTLFLIKSFWKGGETIMVDVYVALIVHKLRTIDQVPAQLRPAVSAELNTLGLDGHGNPMEG